MKNKYDWKKEMESLINKTHKSRNPTQNNMEQAMWDMATYLRKARVLGRMDVMDIVDNILFMMKEDCSLEHIEKYVNDRKEKLSKEI
jgi:hypothetical protein